jgi:hypothetical protein
VWSGLVRCLSALLVVHLDLQWEKCQAVRGQSRGRPLGPAGKGQVR